MLKDTRCQLPKVREVGGPLEGGGGSLARATQGGHPVMAKPKQCFTKGKNLSKKTEAKNSILCLKEQKEIGISQSSNDGGSWEIRLEMDFWAASKA